MDFYKVPIGFGMALAMNQPAMNACAAVTQPQKQAVLNRAHNVRSEQEMHDLVCNAIIQKPVLSPVFSYLFCWFVQ